MPILVPEPAHFPESLFDDGKAVVGPDRVWWVLHTKPRQEKSLARELHKRQTPFYLPLIRKRWRTRGRLMNSYVPLFDGYLFLLADRQERVAALTTNRIVRTLEVQDQDRIWADLHQVYRLIATGAPVTPEDKLAPGMAVEIKSGPLAGLRGTILSTASGRRFVVQVDFIQRGASVLIDDFTLGKVEPEGKSVARP